MNYLYKLRFILIAFLFEILPYPALAFTVLPIDLDEMITRAHRIFVGTCLSVQQDTITVGQNTLPVTVYTFEVSEPFKGHLSKQITFKHVGSSFTQTHAPQQVTPNGPRRIPFHISGMPEYHPGEEVLLFLTSESVIGLTVPVGLLQGAFFVRKDVVSGKKFLSNGIQNAGFITGHQGPLPFEDLLARIRTRLKK